MQRSAGLEVLRAEAQTVAWDAWFIDPVTRSKIRREVVLPKECSTKGAKRFGAFLGALWMAVFVSGMSSVAVTLGACLTATYVAAVLCAMEEVREESILGSWGPVWVPRYYTRLVLRRVSPKKARNRVGHLGRHPGFFPQFGQHPRLASPRSLSPRI